MSKKIGRTIIKLSQDDILRIGMSTIANHYKYKTFDSKARLLGSPGDDLRAIFVLDDEVEFIKGLDYEQIDSETDYNWWEHNH